MYNFFYIETSLSIVVRNMNKRRKWCVLDGENLIAVCLFRMSKTPSFIHGSCTVSCGKLRAPGRTVDALSLCATLPNFQLLIFTCTRAKPII